MARALALAARGDYRVGRNPRVGAVLVREGRVLAEGFHAESGGPHAEAACFAALPEGASAAGGTLYVTLEPCGPFPGKRTPPCVEAVLSHQLARVVVASADPHPAMGGESLRRLREAGVELRVGVLEAAARRLNGPFFKAQRGVGLPYLTAKWAMSLDGKIACRTGHSQWISGEAAREEVHRLRGEVDAIAVGIGTALADDPRLTRRGVPGGDPLRIVCDSRARLPLTSKLVQSAGETPLLVAVREDAPAARCAALRAAGAEVLACPPAGDHLDVAALLAALGARDLRQVLVEGGGGLLASLFAAGLVDRVQCYLAGRILGGASAPTPVAGAGVERVELGARAVHLESRPVGEDVLIEAFLRAY